MQQIIIKDDKLAVAIQQEPPVSIRLNDGKLKIENGKCRIVPQAGCITDFQLSAFNFEFNQVPWSSEGFYLDERLTFTFDPLFHAGCYYVQEASSMFEYPGGFNRTNALHCAAPSFLIEHGCF